MNRPANPALAARIGVNTALDGVLAAVAVAGSFWLADPAHAWPDPLALPLAGAVAVWLIGVPFGLSRLHWRFSSVRDLVLIGGAAVLTAAMLTLLLVGAGVALPSPNFPPVLALALIVALIAPRLVYRLLRDPAPAKPDEAAATAVLAGTAEDAELFLSAAARAALPYRVTGIIAPSVRQAGRRLHGLDVIGAAGDAGAVFKRLAAAGRLPEALIITGGTLAGPKLAGLIEAAQAHGLRALRAPVLTALAPAEQKLELRPIAIEDLLNRRQVALDRAGMAALIRAKRVLLTGAGGSIGAELARQLAGFQPAELLLLDSSEFALWQIDLELGEIPDPVPRHAVIADVRDAARIAAITRDFQPELVFHAAALKHVPIVEANPVEGLRTNVLGTANVAEAARAAGARLMVLISTDKAVNPSSVMGASKRLAEMIAQNLDIAGRRSGQMRCVSVRFGNVLGSTGSVVPLFRRQLAAGGPLTVTHPEMQRYFMTVREAVSLVLQASVAGSGGDVPDGGVFVLDMGEPVKIVDLARQMIRLAGLEPDRGIEIRFTGLRPGEKLFEELFHGGERPAPTEYPGLLMATPRNPDAAALTRALRELAGACDAGDAEAALAVMARLVPEYAGPHPAAAQAAPPLAVLPAAM